MKFSIVCTYYQRQAQLNKTLESFKQYDPNDFNVVIVDDLSTEKIKLPALPFDVMIIRIVNKSWVQCDPAWNIGISKALQGKPEIIILQNAECYHAGNILDYAKRVTDETYISFGCFGLSKEDTFKDHNLTELIEKNKFRGPAVDANCWQNHPIVSPRGYHFCSAITAKNLIKLNGFDERFSNGLAYDDDYFLHQVKCLGLKVEITDNPIVVHQWHYSDPSHFDGVYWDVNRILYEKFIKENNYRAVHLLTSDL